MKTNNTKRSLLLSGISLLLCASMFVGSTFAWFTDTVSSGRNIIQSGNLDVVLEYKTPTLDTWTEVTADTVLFSEDALWEPGHTEVVALRIRNAGSLALKYDLTTVVYEEKPGTNVNGDEFELSDYLSLGYTAIQQDNIIGDILMGMFIGSDKRENAASLSNSSFGAALENPNPMINPGEAHVCALAISMPEEVGNEANYKTGTTPPSISFGITLRATQATNESDSFDNLYDENAEYDAIQLVDEWDGTIDTAWYFENPTAQTFTLSSAEQLAGLAALVDGDGSVVVPADLAGEITLPVTFAGKTITLDSNVDLYRLDENGNRVSFNPIGDSSHDFSGTFDGNGKTIFNLYQDCVEKHVGLFGAVYEGTVKNLTLDGARIENNGNGYASGIAAYTGASTFENITLKNSTVVNYNHNTGGIVGWCSNNGTTTTFDGINIESSTTIGSWWGSYDTRVGGIVGAMNTGNYVVIKNSTVACQLDVYNDVCSNYQWYNYRTAGMVVADVRDTKTVDGRTEAYPARVTCENVTVIFGDWANYHYCESASYGTPSYADEGEYKFRRVEAGLGYGGVDISACNHAADETHNELIAFDFLFGARDGKGQYGISAFDGVTVTYAN